jgi:hypothetical protein
MRRVLITTLLVLLAVLVVSQFVITALAERQVESRLVEGGGTAAVSLSAIPAVRLLFESGDRLEVQGTGLSAELDTRTQVFERLDRFGDVEIDMSDVSAGPVAVESFRLARSGDEPYDLALSATASPRDLSAFAAGQVSGALGNLAEAFSPLPDVAVPIAVRGQIASEDGRLTLVSGEGRIAGIPAGPIVAAITAAIVSRIGI